MLTYPLRFLFAARPQVLSRVLGVVYRAISTYLIKMTGFTVASGAKTGAITLIQRFGSALNINIHFHMLFLDGVYNFKGRRPTFDRAPRPTPAELTKLLHTIGQRVAVCSNALACSCATQTATTSISSPVRLSIN